MLPKIGVTAPITSKVIIFISLTFINNQTLLLSSKIKLNWLDQSVLREKGFSSLPKSSF